MDMDGKFHIHGKHEKIVSKEFFAYVFQ